LFSGTLLYVRPDRVGASFASATCTVIVPDPDLGVVSPLTPLSCADTVSVYDLVVLS